MVEKVWSLAGGSGGLQYRREELLTTTRLVRRPLHEQHNRRRADQRLQPDVQVLQNETRILEAFKETECVNSSRDGVIT